MDTSKVSQGQLIAAIGGIVLIVSLFLDWFSGPAGFLSQSGFEFFSGMDIIMLIVGLAAIAWAAASLLEMGSSLPWRSSWFLTVFGLVVFGWAVGFNLEQPNAGFGAWLAMFAALAIAYGGFSPLEVVPRQPLGPRKRSAPPTPAGQGVAGGGSGPPPTP